MMKSLILSIAMIVLLPFEALANATPEQTVRDSLAITHESKDHAGFDALLTRIDVDAIARFTLGRHGRSLTEDQLDRFKAALTHQLERNYNQHLAELAEAQLEIIDTRARNDRDVVVRSLVHVQGQDDMSVSWRLLNRSGDWRIVDVEIFGIWLAIEQRAQFSSILDRPDADIDTLIQELAKG